MLALLAAPGKPLMARRHANMSGTVRRTKLSYPAAGVGASTGIHALQFFLASMKEVDIIACIHCILGLRVESARDVHGKPVTVCLGCAV